MHRKWDLEMKVIIIHFLISNIINFALLQIQNNYQNSSYSLKSLATYIKILINIISNII